MSPATQNPSLPLLPRPRQITLHGEARDISRLPVLERLDPDLPGIPGEEMYVLEIGPEAAKLSARTAAGLRWARATLAQLKRLGDVPNLRIGDAPLHKHRGFMLDISRDRVPAMATLLDLVDKMASWKMNHLQLYVEHTVAYAGHDEVWQAASPIRLEELSALDAYCMQKGIALTANQNCLGHFERWLKHPRYAPLGERQVPQMVNRDFFVMPNTLCPDDPGSLRLVEDLLRQLLPRCSGAYVNIGCDEPWDLGRGRSEEVCKSKGRARVFSEYVAKVADIARGLGKRPQFWCDPHPNEDSKLLGDIVALIWGYDGGEPFDVRAETHRAAGREIWAAPGTSCWNGTTGRTWNRRANLDHAASIQADGFLCTAWGDGGHRQPWPITLFGCADAAMAAWSGPGAYDDAAAGLHAFGAADLGGWLAGLGNVDREICKGQRPAFGGGEGMCVHNKTALWQEMNSAFHEAKGVGDLAAWREVAERLDALEASFPAGVEELLKRECLHGLRIAKWTCDRAMLRRSAPADVEARRDSAGRLCGHIAEFSDLWLARSRPGGRNDAITRYANLTAMG